MTDTDTLQLLIAARDALAKLALTLIFDYGEKVDERFPECSGVGAQLTAAIRDLERLQK